MAKKDRIEQRIEDLVSGGEEARKVVNEVFKDEIVQQRARMLAIARAKLALVEKMLAVGDTVASTFLDMPAEELKAELEQEPILDRVKVLDSVVTGSSKILSSLSIVSDMKKMYDDLLHSVSSHDGDFSKMRKFKTVMEKLMEIEERHRREQESAEDIDFEDV